MLQRQRMKRVERPVSASQPPAYSAAVAEAMLAGDRSLRRAFLQTTPRVAERDQVIVEAGATDAAAFLIRQGVAFRSLTAADGRRAVADLLLPGDVVGLDSIVRRQSDGEVVAANSVSYAPMPAANLRQLIEDASVRLRVMSLLIEAQQRADRHVFALARLDAQERIASCLIGVYDRLRRRQLISRPTFNLPLTQDQLADYLGLTPVHVSRTLKRLREERLASVDRQVVILRDVPRLRALAAGGETGTLDEENVLPPPRGIRVR